MNEINVNLNPLLDVFNYFANLSRPEATNWIIGLIYLVGFFVVRRMTKNDNEEGYDPKTKTSYVSDDGAKIGIPILMVFVFAASIIWIPVYLMYRLLTFGIIKRMVVGKNPKFALKEKAKDPGKALPMVSPPAGEIINIKSSYGDKLEMTDDPKVQVSSSGHKIEMIDDQKFLGKHKIETENTIIGGNSNIIDKPSQRESRRYEYRKNHAQFGASKMWSEQLDQQQLRYADYVLDHLESKLVKNRYGNTDTTAYHNLKKNDMLEQVRFRKYEYRFGNNSTSSFWADVENPEWHKLAELVLQHHNGKIIVLKDTHGESMRKIEKLKYEVLSRNPKVTGVPVPNKPNVDKYKHLTPYIDKEFGTKEQRENDCCLNLLSDQMKKEVDEEMLKDLKEKLSIDDVLDDKYKSISKAKAKKDSQDIENKSDWKEVSRPEVVNNRKNLVAEPDDILADDQFLEELRKL